MNRPAISIVIPVYGVERYIERCARSLFEQSLDDIEYIFVDDCTPDRSMEVLKRVLDDYPLRQGAVRILHTKENSGQHIARRIGIEVCTGEYVTHCDPDDAYAGKDVLEKVYAYAKANEADIVWYDMLVEDGETGIQKFNCQRHDVDVESTLCTFLTDFKIMASLCNRFVKREIVQDTNIVWPVSPINEDTLLVAQYHMLSRKTIYLPIYIYIYISGDYTAQRLASTMACCCFTDNRG